MAEHYSKLESASKVLVFIGLAIVGVSLFMGELEYSFGERREVREKFAMACEEKYPGRPRTQEFCTDKAMANWVKGGGE